MFFIGLFAFWLIGLKSQWAYLIINHKLCTVCGHIQMEHMEGDIPYPYLPPPTPTPTHPYYHLPPPTPTTPYHHPPLLPPTTTHPYYK